MKTKKCVCGSQATKEFYTDPEEGSICVCENKKCEDSVKKRIYNKHKNEYNQGRSYESYKYSSMVVSYCIGLLALSAICYLLYTIFNSI